MNRNCILHLKVTAESSESGADGQRTATAPTRDFASRETPLKTTRAMDKFYEPVPAAVGKTGGEDQNCSLHV